MALASGAAAASSGSCGALPSLFFASLSYEAASTSSPFLLQRGAWDSSIPKNARGRRTHARAHTHASCPPPGWGKQRGARVRGVESPTKSRQKERERDSERRREAAAELFLWVFGNLGSGSHGEEEAQGGRTRGAITRSAGRFAGVRVWSNREACLRTSSFSFAKVRSPPWRASPFAG